MKTLRILSAGVILLFVAISGFSQDNPNYEKYLTLLEQKDTIGIKQLLTKWNQEDPEYYVAVFNYWLLRAKKEVISINAGETDNEDSFILYDKNHKPAGYMSGDIVYEESLLNRALGVIEKGIEKFPDRLDLRFGMATIYIDSKQTDKALDVIKGVLDQTRNNNDVWFWSLNQPAEPNAVTEGMQGYFNTFVQSVSAKETEALADLLVEYYPKNPIFLSDKASCLYNNWQFEDALHLYEEAFQQDTTDLLIAGNIAFGYYELNRYDESIPYLETVYRKSQDAREKDWAMGLLDRIESLKATVYKKVNINELKQFAQGRREEFDALLTRFQNADTTLTDDEVFLLYYSSAFTGYKTDEHKIKDIDEPLENDDYEKAYTVGKEILKNSPFSLKVLYYTCMLADELKKEDAVSLANQLYMVSDAIMSTGNGCSLDCPIAVTNMDDEYFLLRAFGMKKLNKQATIRSSDGSGVVDKMDFVSDGGAKTRYFNVDILFCFY